MLAAYNCLIIVDRIPGQLAQHLRSSQPKGYPPTPKGTWRNFGETRGGVGKVAYTGAQKQQYL